MKPRRFTGLAAVLASAVIAGVIESSSGSAITAPTPRRKVRLGNASLEINIGSAPGYECPTAQVGASLVRICSLRFPHLKRRALGDAENQRLEPVVGRRAVPNDPAYRRRIVVLDAAAERVDQQLLREGGHHRIGLTEQPAAQTGGAVELRPVWQRGRHIDRLVVLGGPPLSRRVEILEGEAERIHARVATRARRIGAVLLHALAKR